MSTDRRYDDDEVREIFTRATRAETSGSPAPASQEPAAQGMTLAELQEIGAEAGIDPALVARAAASLEGVAEAPPALRQFGVPISVERVVELPARLEDEDFDRLVVHLRDIFHARGTVLREGSLRSWSNGNLQILMEPRASGYRLRMRSLSGDVRGRLAGGLAVAASGVFSLGASILAGGGDTGMMSALLATFGIGGVIFVSGVRKSRSWRTRRAHQFEEIGELARSFAEARARDALPPT